MALLVALVVSGASHCDDPVRFVFLEGPTEGTLTTAQEVSFTAIAPAQGGAQVAKVVFKDNDVVQGEDADAPYTFDWSVTHLENGTHSWVIDVHYALGDGGSAVLLSDPLVYQVAIGRARTGGGMTIGVSASRPSGVAPLSVFFDATDTTHADPNVDPFRDLLYRWSFDDGASGNWEVSGRSKNASEGPVAAHVFERPGSYAVTLTVEDASGAIAVEQVDITVEDPDVVFAGSNTVCFSVGGDFRGCPAGGQHITTGEFSTVAGNIQAGRRLLLHRGETWLADSSTSVDSAGPGLIGAYGEGPKPLIESHSSEVRILQVFGWTDWRLVDLHFVGPHSASADGARPAVVNGEKTIRQFLSLRVEAEGFKHYVLTDGSTLGYYGVAMNEDLAFVDDYIHDNLGNQIFVSAYRLAVLGTHVERGGAHNVRTPFVGGGVIAHNKINDVDGGRYLGWKLHAPLWTGNSSLAPGTYSEDIVISDNIIENGNFGVQPQNGQSDERIRNVIFERNFYDNWVILVAQRVTARNNIGVGAWGELVFGDDHSAALPSDFRRFNHAYHNTCYRGLSSTERHCVSFSSGYSDYECRNNLAFAPSATGTRACSGSAGVISHNLDAADLAVSPFVVADPVVPVDFRLRAGSPAINAGVSLPVLNDFDDVSRPQYGFPDIGAWETR